MRQIRSASKSQLSKIKLGTNMVLVHVESNEGRTTQGGIIIGFNLDVVYGEGTGSHAADAAEVHGVVFKCCDKLFYQKDDPYTMSWDTDIMIQEGDQVWFNYIVSTHTVTLDVDGEMYLLIPYGDLFVAKRGETVIPLNGYVLLEEVKKEEVSFLYLAETDKMDQRRGIVRYVGEPNREYRVDAFSDDIDIAEGDMVQLRSGFTPYRLERQSYFADFGEMLLVVQRRNIEFNYGKN